MSETQQRVAIVYHFFAHYRRPLLERLALEKNPEFEFVSDTQNRLVPGVKVWEGHPNKRVVARCIPFGGGGMWQRGLIRLACRKDLESIIYLGDWKWPATWLSAILARRSGKRVLFWTHGWRFRESGPKSWVRRLFYSIPHGLLLYGKRAKSIACDYGFESSNVYVLFNSLDHKLHLKLRAKAPNREQTLTTLFGTSGNPVVICSSRLTPSKRLDLLIKAVHSLRITGRRDINIILIGDGEAKESLRELSSNLQVRTHFEGPCFNEERIAELTSASTLTVVPGAVGLTAIQSLTFGVPVITSDNWQIQGPEAEAISSGTTGDFYAHGNEQSLAQKIFEWTHSPLVSTDVRSNCMSVVDQYYNPEFQTKVLLAALAGLPAEV